MNMAINRKIRGRLEIKASSLGVVFALLVKVVKDKGLFAIQDVSIFKKTCPDGKWFICK